MTWNLGTQIRHRPTHMLVEQSGLKKKIGFPLDPLDVEIHV